MASTQTTWENLCTFARETALLQSTQSLLEWDERTLMPSGAGPYRAEQVTYLAGMIHRRRTNAEFGQWLGELADSELASDPHSDAAATIREFQRDYDRLTKLPQTLVEETTRASVVGQQTWVTARENNDFEAFKPQLEKLVDLKRQAADALGFEESPYDALLDEYEPGAKTSEVANVLKQLADAIVPLIQRIAESDRQAPSDILRRRFPTPAQQQFGRDAAKRIGFDFDRGVLSETHHPFCSEMGPDDCRITTRYDEQYFPTSFFGTLHEAGHGIYQQGLRTEQFGLPPGDYISLGIHESQSRLWENLVGRSRAFWNHFYPLAQSTFPEALSDVSPDDFYFAINEVRPSLIRVEADEITYNMHIVVRFELEQALVSGELAVPDLPDAWNQRYEAYLGITPPDDAAGVLQDIHWSAGLFGYFPTYSLGNLYASQFFEQAQSDLGDLEAQISRGDFDPLREWLTEKIHRPGKQFTAAELVRLVTGRPLDHTPLVNHLYHKFGTLYGVQR